MSGLVGPIVGLVDCPVAVPVVGGCQVPSCSSTDTSTDVHLRPKLIVFLPCDFLADVISSFQLDN